MRIGIIGHGASHFTVEEKLKAQCYIYEALRGLDENVTLVLEERRTNGVDSWAEDLANGIGVPVERVRLLERECDRIVRVVSEKAQDVLTGRPGVVWSHLTETVVVRADD